MTPIYEVKNLYFSYNDSPILEDINFSLPPGVVLTLTGPNGGGKTTLLKLLLGLLSQSQGSILYHGDPLKKIKQKDFKVGYLPQLSTHEGLSTKLLLPVREVIEMGIFNQKLLKKKEEHVNQVMKNLKLLPLKDKLFSELSGGQKQRVLLARAIIEQPEVLILDEPSTGIDSESQQFLLDFLKDIKKQSTLSIILVTHDMNIVPSISDLVACLNKRLYLHDNPQEYMQCPVIKEQLKSGMEFLIHGQNIPHRVVSNHPLFRKG